MKITCDRKALSEAMGLITAVVPRRTPTPSLTCVKIEATKNGGAGSLTLSGTDADRTLTLGMEQVDVSEAGSVAVPAEKFRQIVDIMESDATVSIETGKDKCHIRGERSAFHVFSFPAEEMPPVPDFNAVVNAEGRDAADAVFRMPVETLVQMVSGTIFATARETTRYAINGILMKWKGNGIEMVATDGRRLARICSKLDGKKAQEIGCLIPVTAASTALRLAGEPGDQVRIAITHNRIFFAFYYGADANGEPRAILSSTLVEGTFPPYQDVIPKENGIKVVGQKEFMVRTIRQAALFTDGRSAGVKFAFDAGKKELTAMSRTPENGDAEVRMGLETIDGADITIAFNPSFLLDVMKVVDGENVIMEMNAPNKPGVIRTESGDFTYVLMPVNLPEV